MTVGELIKLLQEKCTSLDDEVRILEDRGLIGSIQGVTTYRNPMVNAVFLYEGYAEKIGDVYEPPNGH